MGKRSADEIIAAARQNGYERGAHEREDERRGQGKHAPSTKDDHERTLQRYVIWHLAAMKEKHAADGLPVPDESMARAECLGLGVQAPDLATVKDFLRFYVATSTPQIDAAKPTAESIVSVAEWFFPAFTNETGTETNKDDRSEIFTWIRRVLVAEGVVVNKRRAKHNFTASDLDRLLLTLWSEDDVSWMPERYRVQFAFVLHVFCWTGARLGAFFKMGLLYEDIEIALQREDGSKWSVIYLINQRWVKGNRDPENIMFGAAAKEHEKLVYNDTALLLAMAIADRALVGIETVADLNEQQLGPGEDYRVLRFHESSLKRPILRKCTKSDGVLEQNMPQRAFLDIFRKTMMNAGYECRTSVHAIRRGLGKKVDERYTPVQRSQHLTQADMRVFGQSYVAHCSSVDGQAAFRGEDSDHRHIDYFQGLGKFREEGLPTELPAHLKTKLYQDPRFSEMEKSKIPYYRRKIHREALRQYQKEWVQQRRDQKIATKGQIDTQDGSEKAKFDNICLIIPERGRLGRWMLVQTALDPREKWLAIDDLRVLCGLDPTVYYLPNARPVDDACPVTTCRQPMSKLPKERRAQHIQICTRRDMAIRLQHMQTDVHYCYLCYEWVVGDPWEPHCRDHLLSLNSRRCGTYTQCHTLVRPGYCLFCLGNYTLPASKRLQSWRRDHSLWTHIYEHVERIQWPISCPHPLCSSQLRDNEALEHHFIDQHDLSRTRPSRECPSRSPGLDTGDVASSPWLPCETPGASQFGMSSLKRRRLTLTVSPSQLMVPDEPTIEPFEPLPSVDHGEEELVMPTADEIFGKTRHQGVSVADDLLFSQFIRSPSPEVVSAENLVTAISPTAKSAAEDHTQPDHIRHQSPVTPKPRIRFHMKAKHGAESSVTHKAIRRSPVRKSCNDQVRNLSTKKRKTSSKVGTKRTSKPKEALASPCSQISKRKINIVLRVSASQV